MGIKPGNNDNANQFPILSLFIGSSAPASGDDFVIQSMVLEEGYGRIPTAWLTLYSAKDKKRLKMDELSKLLDVKAAVEILNRVGDNKVQCQRWMSGIITEVQHLGVVRPVDGNRVKQPVFAYKLVIQPPLAKLCRQCSAQNFDSTSLRDVIKDILKKGNCDETFKEVIKEGSKVMDSQPKLSQEKQTDYEFFRRVLAAAKLSFCYRMRSPSTSGEMPSEELCIFDDFTSANLVSDVSQIHWTPAADDSHVAKVPLYYGNFKPDTGSDAKPATAGKMQIWEMINYRAEPSSRTSFGPAEVKRTVDCGGTGQTGEKVPVPFEDDVKRSMVNYAAEDFRDVIGKDVNLWMGVTDRLEARIAAELTLTGFYGTTDKDCDIGNLVVAFSRLYVVSPVSDELVHYDPSDLTYARQVFNSIACFDLASLSDRKSDPVPVPTPQPTPVMSGAKVEVIEATVCDGDAKTDDKNNRADPWTVKETGYLEFYAISDDSAKVAENERQKMVVRLVQPIGGLGQGAFRVPRIGERILVLRYTPDVRNDNCINYLHGYLPCKSMEFEKKWQEGGYASPLDAMLFRFDQTEKAKSDSCRKSGDVTSSDGEKNLLDDLKFGKNGFDCQTRFRHGALQNKFSELGFYQNHESAVKEKTGDKIQSFTDKNLRVRGALANLQSTGDVQVSANDMVEINGRNVHIACPGWSVWRETTGPDGKKKEWRVADGRVEVDDVNEFVVRANRRIVLQVGGSTLVIDRDGIVLDSCRWRKAAGLPFISSCVALSSTRGVSINGNNVKVAGVFGSSITDEMGGGFVTHAGVASVSGIVIHQKTSSGKAAGPGIKLGILALKSIAGPVMTNAMGAGDPSTLGKFVSIAGVVGDAVGLVGEIKASGFKPGDDEAAFGKSNVTNRVFKIISTLLDGVIWGVRKAVSAKKWESGGGTDNKLDGISMSDAFEIAALCTKLLSWLTMYLIIVAKNGVEILGVKTSSTITLTPNDVHLKTGDYKNATLKNMLANSATAATDIEDLKEATSTLEQNAASLNEKTDSLQRQTDNLHDRIGQDRPMLAN